MPDDRVGAGSVDPRHLLLVGAGPGLGEAVARRFAEGGYRVTLVSRSTDSLRKLDPRTLVRNPVIFVVEVVSAVVTIRLVADAVRGGPIAFDAAIAIGLWFTVLFANFAEATAEGRG